MQTNRTMAIVPWVLVAILGAALIFISTKHRNTKNSRRSSVIVMSGSEESV